MDGPVAEGWIRLPVEPLRPFVERYIGYRYEGFPPGIHRGLPSRHLTFIFSLGPPIEVAVSEDPGAASVACAAVLAGYDPAPVIVRHGGTQVGISLELTPLGVRRLFGVPAASLASASAHPEDVGGKAMSGLHERLHDACSWDERFTILDHVLLRCVREAGEPPAEVAWAWRRTLEAGGSLPVGALAKEVGWSRRHLADRFRREIGLSPKTAARVVRFERARRLLERADRPALGDIAYRCGYADQAHLTREWREFAGCPPRQWLSTELPSVQDGGMLAGAK